MPHPLITTAYAAFNSRDIDTALTTMRPDVRWPKAFEGDFVTGHDEIREYWTRQWGEINPKVDLLNITELPDGRLNVQVHQVVKALDGTVLFDGTVTHLYTLTDGLIQAMEIGS
jgi:hypothetical protein